MIVRRWFSSPASRFDDISRTVVLLQKCGNAKDVLQCRQLHAKLVDLGLDRDRYLGNHIVQMFGACGLLQDAEAAFSRIHRKNVFSWNIMSTAYTQNGHLLASINLFEKSPERSLVSWNLTMAAYVQSGQTDEALDLLLQMPQRDVVSWTTLLAAFTQIGHLAEAKLMFGRMPQWTIVTWNALVSACSQQGHHEEALLLFGSLLAEGITPEAATLVGAIDSCEADLSRGRLLHETANEMGLCRDTQVGTALVKMYGKLGMLEQAISSFDAVLHQDTVLLTAMLTAFAQSGQVERAKEFFDAMSSRDVVAWNAMLNAYAQNGHSLQALALFRLMDLEGLQPNSATMATALDSCSSLSEVKALHEDTPESELMANVILLGTLVRMYAKFGAVDVSWHYFSEKTQSRSVVTWNIMLNAFAQAGELAKSKTLYSRMPGWDVPSWNTMISALGETGQGMEALQVFRTMDLEGVTLERSTLVCIVEAMARMPEVCIPTEIVEACLATSDPVVAASILNVYAKCGRLHKARNAFDGIPRKSLVVWNTMLMGYAHNGQHTKALSLFWSMSLDGVLPDRITFCHALFACSHAGLMDEESSMLLFRSMVSDFGIPPVHDHYNCILDHLGRTGRISEAQDLLEVMPFEPDFVTWMSLFSAAGMHGDSAQRLATSQLAAI